MIITAKVSLRPFMMPILVLSAMIHWDWLTNKCFKVEVLSDNSATIESK